MNSRERIIRKVGCIYGRKPGIKELSSEYLSMRGKLHKIKENLREILLLIYREIVYDNSQ